MTPHRRKANRTTPQRLRDTALKPMLFYVALTELKKPGCFAAERPMLTLDVSWCLEKPTHTLLLG